MARYGMAIDLGRCIGCRTCMVACKVENGTPASHFFMYTFRFEEGVFPRTKMRYLPRPCNHCEDAPCVKACPVDARIHWKDGFVLTDADNCQGIRACEKACPYGVNYFNVTPPERGQYLDWQNPNETEPTGNLPFNWKPELDALYTWEDDRKKKFRFIDGAGHRINTQGKCTFCVHRIESGKTTTACQNACPVNAIHFGDLDDPESPPSKAIREAGDQVFQLKPEAGTKPKVYYLGKPPAHDARLVEIVEVAEGVQLKGEAKYGGGTVPWK